MLYLQSNTKIWQNYDMGKSVLIWGLTQCVIVLSIDIKNFLFSADTKRKTQFSYLPVKWFVVKSVKQDRVIIKGGELFREVQVQCKKNMQHP